ncbi:hypothetical protein PspLS_10066 [Pyricularia sp. CBS 133598]|nr:hypothetical protein PspLS_10066 [Pyricularia sp. CBS 133598]
MPPTNKAALLLSARANPMPVEAVDYLTVGDGELIIKVAGVALNPIGWMPQALGDHLFNWLQYPFIVVSFTSGDCVLALVTGFIVREGAFREYFVVVANLVTSIPKTLPFANAAMLPLGLATVAGLFYELGGLELNLPRAGASNGGASAVQLATASGYEVSTTSSPHNFDLCKSLGLFWSSSKTSKFGTQTR